MTDLDDFIGSVRDDDLPTARDEDRVLGKIRTSLLAATLPPDGPPPDGASSTPGGELAVPSSSGASKLGVVAKAWSLPALVVGVGVGSAAALGLFSSSESSKQTAEPSQATAPAQETAAPQLELRPPAPSPRSLQEPKQKAEDKPVEGAVPSPTDVSDKTAASSKTPAQSPSSDLQRELKLLRKAQGQYRAGDFEATLETLQNNHVLDQALAEERAALKLLASCRLNRSAADELESFLRMYPHSVQSEALRRSCSSN